MQPEKEKIPWWLWPNVLSLDAPLVAADALGVLPGFEQAVIAFHKEEV